LAKTRLVETEKTASPHIKQVKVEVKVEQTAFPPALQVEAEKAASPLNLNLNLCF
jgi:hypothetical protein